MVQDNWLEDVGDFCVSTLDRLNAKSERGLKMTHQDKASKDVCLGYLFLLAVCNSEGILREAGVNNTLRRNVTLH